MSNIIPLNVPPRRQRLSERKNTLINCFARHRRIQEDVFWLKENAEVLNILECTGQEVCENALLLHEDFYADLPERLGFFPQYYRFLLSIGLDLEDLGMPGKKMEALCSWAARSGLPEAELSDLQRAEAQRLLARRGIKTATADVSLDDRLRDFICRSATFAIPNKKAAYELTHIVFYLSEYGRRDPQLPEAALISLEYAGILAYLDQNLDLLAEVCVALRQAGAKPNTVWEDAVRQRLSGFEIIADETAPLNDVYHEYLVATWAVCTMGWDDSGCALPTARCLFLPGTSADSALRPMSAALMGFSGGRSTDWTVMRRSVTDMLPEEAHAVLSAAEASSEEFDAFFEHFARVPRAAG